LFENRVLRRIFEPKRNEVKGEWRKLHSEELHTLYSSPNIIRQIKSRRMRWAGHVARIREVQGFYGEAGRKESTRKTEAWVGGWDQNGSCGDRLVGCGVDSVGSG
jgi:hypothetical protein